MTQCPNRLLLLVLSLFLLPLCVISQTTSNGKLLVTAVRVERNIELTGRLSDPQWKLASPIGLPTEILPAENIPAAQHTTVRILYSQDNLYVGFDCRDSVPSLIRAHISDRDKIGNDDFVIFFLDTYADNQKSIEFMVNPFGIQGDVLRTGNNEDDSFDLIWNSKAAMNDSGWTAEMEIPFKSLRFSAAPEQQWGILAGRCYPRATRAFFSWFSYDRNNPCLTCQGGLLTGIRGLESTNSLEFLPYVMLGQGKSLVDEDDYSKGFDTHSLSMHVGGGIRYTPSPDFSVDAVVNPDFSQVESDAQQISVNTTSALSYPERRPFFTQGMEIFQGSQNGSGFGQVFYTRSVNNPLAAAKMSARFGKLSLTALSAYDRSSTYIVPYEEGSDAVETEIKSSSNILRTKYDFADESFVGAMVNAKNSAKAYNVVAGVDWSYLFAGNYYFRGEVFGSNTKEVNDPTLYDDSSIVFSGKTATFDGERFAGSMAKLSISRSARDYSFTYIVANASPTFQAHNGYLGSNNFRFYVTEQGYSWYPKESFVTLVNLGFNAGLHYNDRNERKERWLVPGLYLEMKGQTNIFVGYMLVNDELYQHVDFKGIQRGILSLRVQPLNEVGFRLDGQFGKFIYRDNPSMGQGHEFGATLTLRPSSQVQLDWSYSRAGLSDVSTKELYYDGNIHRLVGVYQFTPELFVRLIAQYDSFTPSASLFPLLSYKLNPFSIFYVGVTSDAERFNDSSRFKTTNRQFFMKLQYLFRS